VENAELRCRLDEEARACEGARAQAARAEQAETRAAATVGEARGELRAQDALATASGRRAAELEGELARALSRLQQVDGERAASGGTAEGLRSELREVQDDLEESRRCRGRLAEELAEMRRRAEKGAPQLAEYRRRLGSTETALASAKNEAAEERKARERCHLEAIRAGERLRLAQSQGSQLRERVRALEEAELRYPSRLRRDATGAGTGLASPAVVMPPRSAPPAPAPAASPHCRAPSDHCSAGALDVHEFVAQEERRLVALDLAEGGREAGASVVGASAEEWPRLAPPTAQPPPPTGAGPGDSGSPWLGAHRSSCAAVAELEALLAAQPRALKVPPAAGLGPGYGSVPPQAPRPQQWGGAVAEEIPWRLGTGVAVGIDGGVGGA